MSEEQRELTEEELRDGIPVDPPPDVEDVSEEIEGTIESTEDEAKEPTELPALVQHPEPIERPVMTLNPNKLIDWGYIVNVPFAGKQQPILTVDGIAHVAQTMGVQLQSCEVNESPDGEWFYGKAIAIDLTTGFQWFGNVRQNAKFKNGKSDPQAYEKCSTRAQRNALKRAIPYQRIVNACAQILQQR